MINIYYIINNRQNYLIINYIAKHVKPKVRDDNFSWLQCRFRVELIRKLIKIISVYVCIAHHYITYMTIDVTTYDKSWLCAACIRNKNSLKFTLI